VLDVRSGVVARFGIVGVSGGTFGRGVIAGKTFGMSLLVPELFCWFEDLREEGRRRVHHALSFDLERISNRVRFLQLLRVFVH